MFDSIFYCGMVGTSTGKDSEMVSDEIQELVLEISEILDGHTHNDVINVLVTLLGLSLEVVKNPDQIIDDMVKFLKETNYATQ